MAAQLEILDLRHFSGRQMRPLLEEEARAWKARLRWDYASSTELLLSYLDSRSLPGFVATDRGRIRGFAFCVYEGQKAVVGDAYASGDGAAGVLRTVLEHLLSMLTHSPNINRIESQLLLYDAGVIDAVFEAAGFAMFPRQFLELELREATATAQALPAELAMTAWTPEDYQPAAELIHLAYAGHIDARVNDQYRTLHGSLRFLHNIVRFPGCGVFAAGASWAVRERKSGALVGVVLCSDVGDGVAHVTQLCVAPAYRGRGLGRRLMEHGVAHLRRAGFRAMTLTVTVANVEAVRLYEELGFRVRHGFDAMVWER